MVWCFFTELDGQRQTHIPEPNHGNYSHDELPDIVVIDAGESNRYPGQASNLEHPGVGGWIQPGKQL